MRRSALLLTAAAAAIAAGPAAAADLQVLPYVEVQQLLYSTVSGEGDTTTETSVSAGVDATIATRNVQGQVDYRYDRYFGWEHDAEDQSVQNGLARVDATLAPGVTFDAGGLITRTRTSLREASPVFFVGDTSNTSQLYAAEAGPTLSRSFADLDVSASYHFGYVHVDDGYGDLDLGPGQPILEDYSSSTSHDLEASVGMKSGVLPFGWTVSGGWQRENIHRLGSRYTDRFVRGDVTVPLSWSVAAVGGIGYEWIDESEQQLLTDANGNAVLSGGRHLQGDPNKPRLLVYQSDDLIWDVGALWKPDQRTSLEARYGHRYGGEYWYGSFDHQISPTATFQAGVYNQLDTFGLGVTGSIATLPTSFANPNGAFLSPLNGCVFGSNGSGGGCFDSALQSVSDQLYRERGGWALYSGGRGPWSYGLGVAYAERRYIAPIEGGTSITFAGVTDRSWTGEANAGRQLSPNSSLSGDVFVTWYDSGVPNTPSVTSYGVSGVYQKNFTRHLEGQAGAGLYTSEQEGYDDPVVASLLLGLRYQF